MGFPTRVSRQAMGPTYKNRYRVRDNEREIGEGIFNLLFWQTSGMNVVCDLAWATLQANGALVAAGEAWDPKALVNPTPGHPATGTYTLTYPATAADETGELVPVSFHAAIPVPQTDLDLRATAKVTGTVVTVYVRDAAGTLTDCAVYVGIR